jgi:CheY-like chemotaxis protein
MNTQDVTVLLVDDDADVCANMSDILSDAGYRVDVAHDGPTALELVRRRPYDLALLDLRMPGMDGLTLYGEIKRVQPGAVAVIVSAYASETTVEAARAGGVWQILHKPVDLPRLLSLVDEALGQPLLLVVDDDLDHCANLWDLLRGQGYRVCLAHDADAVPGQLRESTRVVLIDMRLPGGDGGSVFRYVRKANPRARTLLMTGYRAETSPLIERLCAEGADAVHYKPFDVPSLLDSLKSLAGARREGGLRDDRDPNLET